MIAMAMSITTLNLHVRLINSSLSVAVRANSIKKTFAQIVNENAMNATTIAVPQPIFWPGAGLYNETTITKPIRKFAAHAIAANGRIKNGKAGCLFEIARGVGISDLQTLNHVIHWDTNWDGMIITASGIHHDGGTLCIICCGRVTTTIPIRVTVAKTANIALNNAAM